MARMALLSALILVVYQFDAVAHAVRRAWARVWRRQYRQLALDADHYVGTALAVAGMPMALNYLLVSDRPLQDKLLSLSGLFLLSAALLFILGSVLPRLRNPRRYDGVGQAVALAHALASAFQPMAALVPWQAGRAHRDLRRLALALSVPPLLGFAFRWFFGQYDYRDEFIRYMDALVVAMVGGMFMHAVVGPARRYLSSRHVGPVGLLRVVAGLAITFLLFL